jgi:hypothetical protein
MSGKKEQAKRRLYEISKGLLIGGQPRRLASAFFI